VVISFPSHLEHNSHTVVVRHKYSIIFIPEKFETIFGKIFVAPAQDAERLDHLSPDDT
jgi:hypothetical protein